MRPRKLQKLKLALAGLRRGQAKAADLERLAGKLGRKKVKRGSEPTWESQVFAHLYPLSIPHHGGKDIPIGTRLSIIDRLEEDVLAWEARLDEEAENDGEAEEDVENDDGETDVSGNGAE